MIYSYQRVSSVSQCLARQEEAFEKWAKENNFNDYQIFQDKQSGKDFERDSYKKLINDLKKGDLLVIKSIDRLGRNYDMIIEEWTKITKTIGADIVVLDMPLLDTRAKKENLTGKFVSDLVLQILSYVAETERINTRNRQREGIDIALKNGIKFGRDLKLDEEKTKQLKVAYDNGIKFEEIAKQFGISRLTVMNIAKREGWKPRNNRKAKK